MLREEERAVSIISIIKINGLEFTVKGVKSNEDVFVNDKYLMPQLMGIACFILESYNFQSTAS